VTTAAYNIVMKALKKKRAELKASPAAAKKFLVDSGLGDVLENAPVRQRTNKAAAPKKAAVKKSAV
jgi:hypothetical protein